MITTKRLTLRRWIESDRASFAALNADPEVMRYFPSTMTRSESDAFVERIEHHFDTQGWGLFAAEVDGDFAGFIGLSTVTFDTGHRPAPEIGWRLARRFWHQGYATEGARAVLSHAFTTLDMERVVSFTAAVNEPSWRVMERIGMVRVGTFDHPRIPSGELRAHVLYESTREVDR
jgi:RimJ/RimL family protein N-acetyltransferase